MVTLFSHSTNPGVSITLKRDAFVLYLLFRVVSKTRTIKTVHKATLFRRSVTCIQNHPVGYLEGQPSHILLIAMAPRWFLGN